MTFFDMVRRQQHRAEKLINVTPISTPFLDLIKENNTMRLMMCEYTYTPALPDKGPVVHGVCNRRRLEFIIEEGSIVAKMIEDDAAAKLQAKWEGDIEPTVKAKSKPEATVPIEFDNVSLGTTKSPRIQMAPSMPPSGIKK